jgi:putative transposase
MSRRFLLSVIFRQQMFILALLQQIIVFKRTVNKPRIRNWDRLFWVLYSKFIKDWKKPLQLVQVDTVLRWQRDLYKRVWRTFSRFKSKRTTRLPQEVRALVIRIATDNKTWGAERIRGVLLNLGIRVAKSSIQKIIRPLRKNPDPKRSQNWRTFLRNHAPEIWATDFFDVVTVGFKQLYVFVVFSIHTREIVHWNLTEHPTARWTYQQILQSSWVRKSPRFLLADRDSKYGHCFKQILKKNLGIQLLQTPYRAPKANAFIERCIGSIRRECLDHFLIFGENHLREVLCEYVDYYNNCRPHQSMSHRIPAKHEIDPPSPKGEIRSRAFLNGLHHFYYRAA